MLGVRDSKSFHSDLECEIYLKTADIQIKTWGVVNNLHHCFIVKWGFDSNFAERCSILELVGNAFKFPVHVI